MYMLLFMVLLLATALAQDNWYPEYIKSRGGGRSGAACGRASNPQPKPKATGWRLVKKEEVFGPQVRTNSEQGSLGKSKIGVLVFSPFVAGPPSMVMKSFDWNGLPDSIDAYPVVPEEC